MLPEEKEWIGQLTAGNETAFRLLLETYRDRVINICFRFLMNREEAEDAAQEVFIEIFQSIRKFRGDSKLSTWIHRVAVSKSLDELKKKKRKKPKKHQKLKLQHQKQQNNLPRQKNKRRFKRFQKRVLLVL